MEIFESILALLAGIGVFIAGMNMMSGSLQKVAGPGMKKLIGKITNNRFAGVGVGASVTALIQSSAATTVMAIGFVNAGAMTLIQATAIIMGANIGTTVTGLLVSLSSLNISLYASVLAFIGVMMMFVKKDRIRNIGGIICGLGLLFIGLDLMSASFKNDAIKDMFSNIFTAIDFPLLLLLLGVIFTAIMQSSSAMTGLIIVMAAKGAIPLSNALFVILGANIGTCVTALIATIGTSINARRTGIIHLLFNLIGTIVFTIIIWALKNPIVNLLSKINNISYEIAIFHVVFNVVTTAILLPFIKHLVKLSQIIVKDDKKENEKVIKFIDDRLLATPAIAVMQVKREIENMANLAKENLIKSFAEIKNQNGVYKEEIEAREDQIDFINSEITKFLIKLSPLVGGINVKQVGSYYHVVNDIERIGDHAQNFLDASIDMHDKKLVFSNKAKEELDEMFDTVAKMYDIAIATFDTTKSANLEELSKLEKKTDDLKKQLSIAHFERLSQENCTMELGGKFTTIISELERVADHLINIGYSIKDPTGDQPLSLK